MAEGELPWDGIPGSVFSTELIGESSSLTEEDPPPGLLSGGSVTDLYYTVQWQLIEERVDGVISRQNVFSPVYIDAMILRDRDIDMEEQFEGDDSLGYTFDEWLYAHYDANFNVTSLAKDTDPDPADPVWTVAERYLNDAYGAATVFRASYGLQSGNTYRWQTFHQGLRWEGSVGLYDNRNRFLSTSLGRFNKEDPLGFVDGLNLQQYVRGNPVRFVDPSGLAIVTIGPGGGGGAGGYVGGSIQLAIGVDFDTGDIYFGGLTSVTGGPGLYVSAGAGVTTSVYAGASNPSALNGNSIVGGGSLGPVGLTGSAGQNSDGSLNGISGLTFDIASKGIGPGGVYAGYSATKAVTFGKINVGADVLNTAYYLPDAVIDEVSEYFVWIFE